MSTNEKEIQKKKKASKPDAAKSKKRRKNRRKKQNPIKGFLNWLLMLCAVIILAYVVREFVAVPAIISGNSMSETYNSGDVVLVTKFDYLLGKPHRGDVVLCAVDGRDGMYVKRVIGLPGDEISISNGVVSINGEPYNEPYVVYPSNDSSSVTLSNDEYMVLGDNRAVSYDSRQAEMGMLSSKNFSGKVRVRIWPLGK